MDFYEKLKELCQKYDTIPKALNLQFDKSVTDFYECQNYYDIYEGLNIANANLISKYDIIIDYVLKKFTTPTTYSIKLDNNIPFSVVNRFLTVRKEYNRKDIENTFKIKNHSRPLYTANVKLNDSDILLLYQILEIDEQIKRIVYKVNNFIHYKIFKNNNDNNSGNNNEIDLNQLTCNFMQNSEIENSKLNISLENNELVINTIDDAITINTSYIHFYDYNNQHLIKMLLHKLNKIKKNNNNNNLLEQQQININFLVKIDKSNMFYSLENIKEPINFKIFDLMLEKNNFQNFVYLDKNSVPKDNKEKDISRIYHIQIGNEEIVMKLYHTYNSVDNVFYFPNLPWHNHKLSKKIVKNLYRMYEETCQEINHHGTINYEIVFDNYYLTHYNNPDNVWPIKADPELCRKKIVKYVKWRKEYYMAPLGSGYRITYTLKNAFDKHRLPKNMPLCIKIKNRKEQEAKNEPEFFDEDLYFMNYDDKYNNKVKIYKNYGRSIGHNQKDNDSHNSPLVKNENNYGDNNDSNNNNNNSNININNNDDNDSIGNKNINNSVHNENIHNGHDKAGPLNEKGDSRKKTEIKDKSKEYSEKLKIFSYRSTVNNSNKNNYDKENKKEKEIDRSECDKENDKIEEKPSKNITIDPSKNSTDIHIDNSNNNSNNNNNNHEVKIKDKSKEYAEKLKKFSSHSFNSKPNYDNKNINKGNDDNSITKDKEENKENRSTPDNIYQITESDDEKENSTLINNFTEKDRNEENDDEININNKPNNAIYDNSNEKIDGKNDGKNDENITYINININKDNESDNNISNNSNEDKPFINNSSINPVSNENENTDINSNNNVPDQTTKPKRKNKKLENFKKELIISKMINTSNENIINIDNYCADNIKNKNGNNNNHSSHNKNYVYHLLDPNLFMDYGYLVSNIYREKVDLSTYENIDLDKFSQILTMYTENEHVILDLFWKEQNSILNNVKKKYIKSIISKTVFFNSLDLPSHYNVLFFIINHQEELLPFGISHHIYGIYPQDPFIVFMIDFSGRDPHSSNPKDIPLEILYSKQTCLFHYKDDLIQALLDMYSSYQIQNINIDFESQYDYQYVVDNVCIFLGKKLKEEPFIFWRSAYLPKLNLPKIENIQQFNRSLLPLDTILTAVSGGDYQHYIKTEEFNRTTGNSVPVKKILGIWKNNIYYPCQITTKRGITLPLKEFLLLELEPRKIKLNKFGIFKSNLIHESDSDYIQFI